MKGANADITVYGDNALSWFPTEPRYERVIVPLVAHELVQN